MCHTLRVGNNADWLAEYCPGTQHTTSLRATFDHDLDGVVIATPSQTHGPLVLECLHRDLHVLVEKPAATLLIDAQSADAEAAARSLVLRTGYTHSYDTTLRALADLVPTTAAPNWRLTWHKPAPGTGPSDIVWEYFPHVLAIAHLLGGGIDPALLSNTWFRVTREPSGTGTVEAALPVEVGVGTVEVSTRPGISRHKQITLFDGDQLVAEWTDRHLLDRRDGLVVEATEEPLMNQVRSFLDAVAAPSLPRSPFLPSDVCTTELLVALASKIQPVATSN